MVQINFALKEVNCKVVYYGPGMSGKTTNLEIVYKKAPEQHRGELTSISTDGDRTLFFDYMPLDLGTIAGMRTKFQLYTVPGQVYYNSTRKLVLQGVDGVVFVAESDPTKMQENLESLANLEENLREYGKELRTLPHVIQWNKRDLPGAVPVPTLNAQLNRYGAPNYEAIARTGEGVFPTLKALAALVLESLNRRDTRGGQQPPAAPLPQSTSAPVFANSNINEFGGAQPAAARPQAPTPARPPSVTLTAAAGAVAAARTGGVRQAPASQNPKPAHAARPAVRAATTPSAQPATRRVVMVTEDDASSQQRSNRGIWIGVLVGALGALAVLGIVFLFLFK
ncbi:MAG: GTPase domain-containing protein [Planctomycetes bacterium]|nr:GTPase domain-containing protein [Planctomycetota bacterium]